MTDVAPKKQKQIPCVQRHREGSGEEIGDRDELDREAKGGGGRVSYKIKNAE